MNELVNARMRTTVTRSCNLARAVQNVLNRKIDFVLTAEGHILGALVVVLFLLLFGFVSSNFDAIRQGADGAVCPAASAVL